ncbi:MAG: hypothetical protein PHZ00_06055 [Candidatus Peribacteraceae bacterium]|nr:hypothetical protein [Candidatus Peribacteraceae bacterium]
MKKHTVIIGEIYKVGDHIVACGDSRDSAFVSQVIGKNSLFR